MTRHAGRSFLFAGDAEWEDRDCTPAIQNMLARFTGSASARARTPPCVQSRLVCSVEVSPTGVTARRPVAWIAARKETEWSEAYRQSHRKGW